MEQTFLRIYETFSSIQGESSYAGKPCFFIRLAGCQLNCAWCDTKKARSFNAGSDMSIAQLLKLTQDAAIPLVEITGGEPLMQKNVIPLCQALLDAGFTAISMPLDTAVSMVWSLRYHECGTFTAVLPLTDGVSGTETESAAQLLAMAAKAS